MQGSRRDFSSALVVALGCAAAGFVTAGFVTARAQEQEPEATARRIAIDVRRFVFRPSEIQVKRGETVTFVLVSSDFTHGFSIPDFNVRLDVVPGRENTLTLTPDKVGRFTFLCDNFCGDGHEGMDGVLVVAD